MLYSQVFRVLYFIVRATGIFPYSTITRSDGSRKLKLSSRGVWYAVFYSLSLSINTTIIFLYMTSFASYGSVKNRAITTTFALAWTVSAIGINLNQIFRFNLIKRPIQYLLDTSGKDLAIPKCYSAILLTFLTMMLLLCVNLVLVYPWYKPHEMMFWLVVNIQVECCFAVTVFLLHVLTNYVAQNLQSLSDKIQHAMVRDSQQRSFYIKKMKPLINSKQPAPTEISKSRGCGKNHEIISLLDEVTEIRKVIDDLQEYFKIPVLLLLMFTVIIFTSYLFYIGVNAYEDGIIYRYTAMVVQVSEIWLLVDSQNVYNEAVSIFKMPETTLFILIL